MIRNYTSSDTLITVMTLFLQLTVLLFCLQLITFPRYFVSYISSRLASLNIILLLPALFSIQQIWRLFSILFLPSRTIVFPPNFVPYSNMVSILSPSSYKTISYWRVDGSGTLGHDHFILSFSYFHFTIYGKFFYWLLLS